MSHLPATNKGARANPMLADASKRSFVAVLTDGSTECWGDSDYGCTGHTSDLVVGTPADGWAPTPQTRHFGENDYGRCWAPSCGNPVPSSVVSTQYGWAAIKSDGTIATWGRQMSLPGGANDDVGSRPSAPHA